MKYAIILTIFFSVNISAKELTLETSNEYLTVMDAKQHLTTSFDILINPLIEGTLRVLAQNVGKKGLSQEQTTAAINAMRPHLISIKDSLKLKLDKIMPYEELQKEVYHPAFSDSFSDEELTEIIEFIRTPLGKKYAQESVLIMQKTAQLSQERFGPRFHQQFTAEMAKVREQAINDVTAAIDGAK